MKLYTIGFTQKSAETFFETLRANGIQRVVDIRLHPSGQLSGFAKQGDLPYLLKHLAENCRYEYMSELAPTKEILDDYRADKDWARYCARFQALLDERNVPDILNRDNFEQQISCFLCSEPTPKHCHRRLVAERLAAKWNNTEVIHL